MMVFMGVMDWIVASWPILFDPPHAAGLPAGRGFGAGESSLFDHEICRSTHRAFLPRHLRK